MKVEKNTADNERVGLLRRFAVIIYDGLLLLAALFFALIPATVVSGITYESPWYPLIVLYIYLVGFLYFGWFWRRDQTLGMKTWRVIITDRNGGRISWKQALIRYLVACVSWLAFGMGFFWALFNKERLTWHDLASRTRLRHRPQ